MRLFKTVFLSVLAFCAALHAEEESRVNSPPLADGLYAEFTLAHGTLVAELFANRVPMTVAHFIGLTEGTLGPRKGQPYYAGLTWYRVVPGFVIQSGNPNQPADGNAGPSFPDEFAPGLRHGEAGVLSMANAGPDTNSAEFFITLGNDTRLNYLHSVFGRVVRGIELLPQIKPDEPFSLRILRIGPTAQKFTADEATCETLVTQAPRYHGETEPGLAAHFADPDNLLPTEPPRARYFNYKLNNFQRATGVKIVARIFAKSPSAAEDEIPGAFMHALAAKLGVARRGALAAYFADEKDWRVWIGDESTTAFFGRATTTGDLVADGAFHKVKEAFLDATRAAGDAAFLAEQKAAAPGKAPAAAQQLKLQTDAVLDGLMLKLEPAPQDSPSTH